MRVHVGVGSNIDPPVHVPGALARLRDRFGRVDASRFFRVPAIGRPDQPDYWNGVLRFDTDLDRDAVRAALREVEDAEGRVRTDDRYAARTLDLDVLLWDGTIIDSDLHRRPFLAQGLVELGDLPPGVAPPSRTHPVVWAEP